MNTGIFGGTFHPIHRGHTLALQNFRELAHLDRILVFPAGIPPHKALAEGAGDEDRLAMVRLAVKGLADVDDYEIRKGGKSYTVETLRYVREKFPDDRLFLYVGSDMLLRFETAWYQYREILGMATLTALSRTGTDFEELCAYAGHLRKAYGADVLVGTAQPLAISSTEIRKQLAAGGDVSDVLDSRVLDYIRQHHLYGVKDV